VIQKTEDSDNQGSTIVAAAAAAVVVEVSIS